LACFLPAAEFARVPTKLTQPLLTSPRRGEVSLAARARNLIAICASACIIESSARPDR
jgi:hypothetical protein